MAAKKKGDVFPRGMREKRVRREKGGTRRAFRGKRPKWRGGLEKLLRGGTRTGKSCVSFGEEKKW